MLTSYYTNTYEVQPELSRKNNNVFSHVTIERFRTTFTENGKLQLHVDNF